MLKSKWYNHLKEDGIFIDVEDDYGLKDRGSEEYLRRNSDSFQAKVSYYQWAQGKVNEGRFTSERDRLIWEYHAEGLSKRQIAPRIGLEQSWIGRKINMIKASLKDICQVGSVSYASA